MTSNGGRKNGWPTAQKNVFFSHGRDERGDFQLETNNLEIKRHQVSLMVLMLLIEACI